MATYNLKSSSRTVDLGSYPKAATSGFYLPNTYTVQPTAYGVNAIQSFQAYYALTIGGTVIGGAGTYGNGVTAGKGGAGIYIGPSVVPGTLPTGGVYVHGHVTGGAGGNATHLAGGIGGAGGAGVVLGSHTNDYNASLTVGQPGNPGSITGGAGGMGYLGGAGATGAVVNGYVYLSSAGSITGGAGGLAYASNFGKAGGSGGTGLDLSGGSQFAALKAGGTITGGAGGGGAAESVGGVGGTGVVSTGDGISNYADITGGAGGAAHYFGAAGDGGVGVYLANFSVLYNHGQIHGGAAGGGEMTGNVSAATGGVGALVTCTGTASPYTYFQNSNDGKIYGGAGGVGAGGTGGAGARVIDSGTFSNQGYLKGGDGGFQFHGTGGTGGVGMAVDGSGAASGANNSGMIVGGAGGNDAVGLNNAIGTGGTGGVGVDLTSGGSMLLGAAGAIVGGKGGLGGALDPSAPYGSGTGGIGGVGVYLGSNANLFVDQGNSITGGAGGGSAAGQDGAGGTGVVVNGGDYFFTAGTISGGQGGQGGATATSGAAGDAVDFGPQLGSMIVGSGAVFNGGIGGFAIGDTIDMRGLSQADVLADFHVSGGSVGADEEFRGSAGGETLTTTALQNEGTLQFLGNFAGDTFVLSTDGAGTGTDITLQAACYHRGTRIRTLRGEIPIEELAVGEGVITASGVARTIRWLGSRRLECRRHPDPSAVWPIRISAGAFADCRPLRDLWVSPGHCLLIDGVLIQAEKLVNGASIVRVPKERVEYWHLELDRHDIVYAEGLPAESYLDTGNRTAFINGGEFIQAFPDFRPKHWSETCAPLVQEGPALHRARETLLERCFVLGHALTRDPAVHLMADGERISPRRLGDSRLAFAVPAGCRRIELRCRTFIPAHVDPASGDTRALGICVGRLAIDGVDVDLDEPSIFAHGWHGLESRPDGGRQRWSRAHAPLPAGTRLVLIELAGPSHVWTVPARAAGNVAANSIRAVRV